MENELHAAEMLRASHIDRWSMVGVNRPQNLAEHIYNVIIIAVELAHRYKKDHLMDAVRGYALIHDLEEVMTGDMPTPIKKYMTRELIELNESFSYKWETKSDYPQEVRSIVKMADNIEALLYLYQHGAGSHCDVVFEEIQGRVNEDEIAFDFYLEIRGWRHRVLSDFTKEEL